MQTVQSIKEERERLHNESSALIKAAREEGREMSDEENARFDEIENQDLALSERQKKAEADEARKARIAAREMANIAVHRSQPGNTPEEKAAARFSFKRLIMSQHPDYNVSLDGVELEMHQEGLKEAKSAQITGEVRGICIPTMAFTRPKSDAEKRILEVATAANAGDLVATDLGPFIEALRKKMWTTRLGVNMIGNLTGNFTFPKHTGVSSAVWATEKATSTETTPTVGTVALTPKRLTAYTRITHQQLAQQDYITNRWIEDELLIAQAQKLDTTAINGSGSGAEPIGIANLTDVNTVAIGANGGAPTRAHLLQMIRDIALDDGDIGDMAFLTTPSVRYKLQTTLLDAGSGLYVWDTIRGNELLSYRAEVSNNVPSTLTKGTGTNLHMVLFGVWNQFVIGQWGPAMSIIVNPYSEDKEGIIRITLNTFWDMNARHDKAFAAIVDADPS